MPESEVDQCSKVFVVDTSVLLHDPEAITVLAKDPENLVIIPLSVLEELDRAKRDKGEKGFNARDVARTLDNLRQNGKQSLKEGVRIAPDKGIILVDHAGNGIKQLASELEETGDNKILVVARNRQKIWPKAKVTIISKDINMRLKADAMGISAEDYLKDKAVNNLDELYSGWTEITIGPAEIDIFTDLGQKREIPASRLAQLLNLDSLFPNQCCKIYCGEKNLLTVYKKKRVFFETC